MRALLFAVLLLLAGCVDMPPAPEEPADGPPPSGTDRPTQVGPDASVQDPLALVMFVARDATHSGLLRITLEARANWPDLAPRLGLVLDGPVESTGPLETKHEPLAPGANRTHVVPVQLPDEDATVLAYGYATAPQPDGSRVSALRVAELTWTGGALTVAEGSWPHRGETTLATRYEEGALVVSIRTPAPGGDSVLTARAIDGDASVRLEHPEAVNGTRLELRTGTGDVRIPLAFEGTGQAQVALRYLPDIRVDPSQVGENVVFEVEAGQARLVG